MKLTKEQIEAFLRDKPHADPAIRHELQQELAKMNVKKKPSRKCRPFGWLSDVAELINTIGTLRS